MKSLVIGSAIAFAVVNAGAALEETPALPDLKSLSLHELEGLDETQVKALEDKGARIHR